MTCWRGVSDACAFLCAQRTERSESFNSSILGYIDLFKNRRLTLTLRGCYTNFKNESEDCAKFRSRIASPAVDLSPTSTIAHHQQDVSSYLSSVITTPSPFHLNTSLFSISRIRKSFFSIEVQGLFGCIFAFASALRLSPAASSTSSWPYPLKAYSVSPTS